MLALKTTRASGRKMSTKVVSFKLINREPPLYYVIVCLLCVLSVSVSILLCSLYQQSWGLCRASESGDLAKVQEYVNRCADLNWRVPDDGVSPLLSIVGSFVLTLSRVRAGNDCSDVVSSGYNYA